MTKAIARLVRKAKRAVRRLVEDAAFRRDAKRAFRYDLGRFIANAGAVRPERREAARAAVVMGYHVLEKGLTMPRRRTPFGAGQAARLASLADGFEARFGSGDPQVAHAADVVRAWADANRAALPPDDRNMAKVLSFLARRPDAAPADEPRMEREAFFSARNSPFPEFAASRRTVRHFAGPVPRETVEAAVALAATAPSACNRQHVRVHAIDDPATRDAVLALHGGTRGFGADIDKLLVVTADLSSVRWAWERADCHVNAGIFAMNLAYALHWHGAACCFLHRSVSPDADVALRRIVPVPESETVAVLLACGAPPERFDVAASPRISSGEILSWHGGGRA